MEASDFAKYLVTTRCSAEEAVVLGIKMIKRVPEPATAPVRVAIGGLHEKTVSLQEVVMDRLANNPESLVPLNLKLSGGWMGLSEGLSALTRLEGTDVAARAAVLKRTLFPRGTAFTRGTHDLEWTTGEEILKLVAKGELEPEIRALVGDHYLPFIREAHAAFGEGLGVGESIHEAIDTTALSAALSAFVKALAEYGRVMVGWVDPGDPEKVAAFKRAMAPLDAHRRKLGAGGGAVEEEVEEEEVENEEDVVAPTDPIPPVGGGEEDDAGA